VDWVKGTSHMSHVGEWDFGPYTQMIRHIRIHHYAPGLVVDPEGGAAGVQHGQVHAEAAVGGPAVWADALDVYMNRTVIPVSA
jgi:hypothetical protein